MNTDLLTQAVKDRFKEFLNGRKLSEIAKITGCHYTVVHNISKGKYTPTLETVFNFKLGYGDEFDEVYILTGKRINTDKKTSELVQDVADSEHRVIQSQLQALHEKLKEKDEQIRDLKQDKEFLQGLLKRLEP
ncbi:hypothetical protein [Fibrella aquatica]|uniref:hypothetical protein n=1 Tax=Fibrella aquatica TaxID=3242487 RepID=UPI0035216275